MFPNYLGDAGRGNNRERRPEPRKHHSVSVIRIIPRPEHAVSYSEVGGGKVLVSGAWLDFEMKEEKLLNLSCCPHSLEKNVAQVSDVYPPRTSKD